MNDIDRAGAIRICAVAASTPGFFVDYGWSDIAGASAAAWDIAFAAYLNSGGDFAEAEAALRDAPADGSSLQPNTAGRTGVEAL